MPTRRRNRRCACVAGLVTLLALGAAAHADGGRFVRTVWYERGVEHGNPKHNSRFRVNDPEIALHPTFGKRSEPRGNGMMQVLLEEDLALLAGASLALELWGGHPGTTNKRVTINGRGTYALPDNGTTDGHCSHAYPTIALPLTDLVNGYNALQFACDRGTSFWGHFIVDNACLRAELEPEHPALAEQGLTGFTATAVATPVGDDGEALRLRLDVPAPFRDAVNAVDFFAFYDGYDENGDGVTRDWHGFTKQRAATAHVGTARAPDLETRWDVAMLAAQGDVRVRAVVRFGAAPELTWETAEAAAPPIHHRGATVRALYPTELPKPFWSRASRERSCAIELPADAATIERAELHVVLWDGGRGDVEHPFTLNGAPVEVAGAGRHDVLYRRVAIDPAMLRTGTNEIRLLSDTDHHGIEVLLPGPALVVRWRAR